MLRETSDIGSPGKPSRSGKVIFSRLSPGALEAQLDLLLYSGLNVIHLFGTGRMKPIRLSET